MLSLVIPAYNEAESLAELHEEISAVAENHGYQIEIIFVDDGSADSTWGVIESLAAKDPRVRGIRFRRNFGKAAALSAGFAEARGDRVLTLAADLQDDPREIPRFLAAMDENLDVISGWKRKRHDPWHKVWPSRVFNWMVSRMTGVKLHDHNCGFKSYRREIFDEVRLYGELHRFVPVLAAARGWKVGEIEVNHRPRVHGKSKYGMHRFVKGFLDLLTVKFLTGYGQRPQHLLGVLGLLFFFVGGLGLLALTIWRIVSWASPALEPIHLTGKAVFFYALAALLLGAQLITVGFLAELITARTSRASDTFSIAERTEGSKGADAGAESEAAPAKEIPEESATE